MSILPNELTKALSDPTRLRIMIMLSESDELCVCELTYALQLDQPKISRHLAVLRNSKLVMDRREGQWIHYRIHPDLPRWAYEVVASLAAGAFRKSPYQSDRKRLHAMGQQSTASVCG